MASNKFFKGIALGALALQLVAPAFAFAEDGSATSNAPRPEGGASTNASFCSRLTTFGSKVDGEMYNREVKIKADRGVVGTKVQDNWKQRDETLAANRAKRDENIQSHFDKISSRNLTDAQKTALATFESVYSAAVTTRQAAVDAAIKTYRDSVASATSSHQSVVDATITAFKASVKTAEDKASADCTSGVDPKTVRSTLVASLQAAKDALQTASKAIDTRGDIIKPLVDARNQAVQAALDAFKTAIEKARADLQAAFPETKN